MIRYLIFKIKINKLFRKREKLQKIYLSYRKDLQCVKGSREEFESLNFDEMTEIGIIDYEIEIITTSYFLRLARLKFIEIPIFSDEKSWVKSSLDPQQKVLSNFAISEIRSKIMKYRKERNEQLVPFITSVTGLAGAIIGIVALCIKK